MSQTAFEPQPVFPHRPPNAHYTQDAGHKWPYESEEQAKAAAERRTAKTGLVHSHYRCGFCPYWHIGRDTRSPAWSRARTKSCS